MTDPTNKLRDLHRHVRAARQLILDDADPNFIIRECEAALDAMSMALMLTETAALGSMDGALAELGVFDWANTWRRLIRDAVATAALIGICNHRPRPRPMRHTMLLERTGLEEVASQVGQLLERHEGAA